MKENEFSLLQYKNLFRLAGISALMAMIVNLLDVVLGFGSQEFSTYGNKSAVEWFAVFNSSRFNGLYALGLFNILYMLFMIPVYSGLLVVHMKSNKILSVHAVVLFLIGIAVYISKSAAIPVMVLSEKYALAISEAQKGIYAAAGEAILSNGEDFTPGAFIGFFLSGAAAVLISVVMLKGRIFGKINSWIGIIGFSFLAAFTFIATFVPSLYLIAFYFFGSLGGVMALAWFFLTARRFLKLGSLPGENVS